MLSCRSVREGLPVLKLLIFVQKLDGYVAVGFLEYSISTLVKGLDFVDD